MRRGLGRGRILTGIGAILALVAMPLDWLKVGGEVMTATSTNGFQDASIAVFVAGVAILALLTLPYASRDGRSSLDRPIAFVVLGGLAIVGFLLRLLQILGKPGGYIGLPDRAPGVWLAGVGVLIIAWGVAEILAEPTPAP